MDPLSPMPAVIAVLVAIFTSHLLSLRFTPLASQGRFVAIDGLRGYLAFFVFLHHASIWYFYTHTGQWEKPHSNLYTHFGQTSVALFFMITAFLFFSKLLNAQKKPLDWARLFISRLLRLYPLYLFSMVLVLGVVAILSHGTLNEPGLKLLKASLRWLSFMGAPNLNGVDHTAIIIAQVTWSLPYEWLFYFSLPFFALLIGINPPRKYLILAIFSLATVPIWQPQGAYLLPFLGGILAAFAVRWPAFRTFANGSAASLVILAALAITVLVFPSSYAVLPLLLLSLAFSLIAAGNNLFGALSSPISRTLGEMAYSIYLLHGIVLFVLFTFVIGPEKARGMTPVSHWTLVISVVPLLIFICYGAFRLIEQPAMNRTQAATTWVRARMSNIR